jgi:hypothetical protein
MLYQKVAVLLMHLINTQDMTAYFPMMELEYVRKN